MRKIYSIALSFLALNFAYPQNVTGNSQTTSFSNKEKIKNTQVRTISVMPQEETIHPERGSGFGQHSCKSHELTKKYYESIGKWDEFNNDYLQNAPVVKPPAAAKTPGVNTIAVIFHVVYNPNNSAENVSYSNIMNVYNDIVEDFQLMNADASQARTQFGFIPADANINFCLATKTPTGTPLTEVGVIRVSTTEDWYDSDGGEENKMKSSATGGSQIWDRNKYLNVWICDISNGANSGTAGYAYRPTTTYLPSASIDGIVIDYNLGVNNDNVLTHEIGHYLGLDHTWGGSGSCTNDDGFADTPNTAGPSFNYSGSCSGNQTTCSTTQTMYENYMDYSNCTVMYTQDQADYMLTILTGIRSSLLLSNGCDPVNAPPVAAFTADLSDPIIIPVGGSVNFFDQSTNVPTSWSWNFGGGAANSTQQNPQATFTAVGTYDVTLTATNAYGSDSETKLAHVQVVAAAAGTACDTLRNYNPVTEDLAYYNWTSGWGFLPGHGRYSTTAQSQIYQYADRYTAPATTYVRRLRFPIAKAVDQSGTGLMKIRIQSDNAGNPGTVLVTDTLLVADMDAGFYNEFDFTNPVQVTGNFWVTFEMIYGTPLDSVALLMVDFDYRNGTIASGASTMKCYYGGTTSTNGTWHPTTDLNPIIMSSLWLDVLTSNGPAPVADFLASDDKVCVGGQITANGSGSQNTTNYYWYMTDDPFTTVYSQAFTAGPTFTFNQVGNRAIYLFADGSCMTDAVYLPVTVTAKPSATVTQTNTTCGQNNGTITITNPTGGDSPNYTYSIDGVNFQTSGTFTNLAPGTYTVYVVTPGDNCDKTYSRTIATSSELTATVSSSTTVCPGESATLTASGGTIYTWYDGSTVIGNTASITVMPTATNQYTCIVSDGTCEATVYTYVYVDACGGLDEFIKQVKIAPNPVNEQFSIELEGDFNYELLDARGRLIETGKGTDKHSVSMYNCSTGVYLLRIKNDQFEHAFRIVKN
ncbi:MAG: PKD domain-containing protein [Bacteroidetes bacterium]|nr:MAG: PKD domain-containing protein [Bacteroidota bacterium]